MSPFSIDGMFTGFPSWKIIKIFFNFCHSELCKILGFFMLILQQVHSGPSNTSVLPTGGVLLSGNTSTTDVSHWSNPWESRDETRRSYGNQSSLELGFRWSQSKAFSGGHERSNQHSVEYTLDIIILIFQHLLNNQLD